ncbi:MAG: hypothetical protein CMM32_00530 [Rhodospirillaceae bacterium]|nr:hypothetical protein [Rhodospirillaceae bacterium]|tara:strand:- start:65 stop:502 length:438 start_codon:yes stop_codon:yes gene_type:complete
MGESQLINRGEIICYLEEHFQATFEVISKMRTDTQPIIRTAPGAAEYAGVQFLWDLIKLAQGRSQKYTEVVLDCGHNPATVFGALRTGWKNIGFTGPPKLQRKVVSLLNQHDGQVFDLNKGPVLSLQHSADPTEDCICWLKGLQK